MRYIFCDAIGSDCHLCGNDDLGSCIDHWVILDDFDQTLQIQLKKYLFFKDEELDNNKYTTGTNSVFRTLGSSSHSVKERQNEDFYATDPLAIDLLCAEEKFDSDIWECCCGQGHLSLRLQDFGYDVVSTDLIDRGFGTTGIDFLSETQTRAKNIITNPPYSLAKEFVAHALSLVPEGGKVAMFLKTLFLEGKGRKKLFLNNPPKTVYVSSSRLICAKNGDFVSANKLGSAISYSWFVFCKKTQKENLEKFGRYITEVRWIN